VSRTETKQSQYSSREAHGQSRSDLLTADERSQLDARLHLTPSERLRYLEDMIAFEELARRARRVT